MAAAAAAANGTILQPYMTEAAVAAVAAANQADVTKLSKKQASEVSKAHRMAKDAEKALEQERRQNMKREQRRLSIERKEHKAREREQVQVRKVAERIARDSTREERRRKKLELRTQREQFAHEQKEAALKRAAELVCSNRVPIEVRTTFAVPFIRPDSTYLLLTFLSLIDYTRCGCCQGGSECCFTTNRGCGSCCTSTRSPPEEVAFCDCCEHCSRPAPNCYPFKEFVGQVQCYCQRAQPKSQLDYGGERARHSC